MPSRDYFLKGRDEKALKSYEQYVVNVAVAMGAPRDRARREIAQMVDFEILLANVRQLFVFITRELKQSYRLTAPRRQRI